MLIETRKTRISLLLKIKCYISTVCAKPVFCVRNVFFLLLSFFRFNFEFVAFFEFHVIVYSSEVVQASELYATLSPHRIFRISNAINVSFFLLLGYSKLKLPYSFPLLETVQQQQKTPAGAKRVAGIFSSTFELWTID